MDLLCHDEHLDNLPEVSSSHLNPGTVDPLTYIGSIIPTRTQTVQPSSALLAQKSGCGLQRMLCLSASFFYYL